MVGQHHRASAVHNLSVVIEPKDVAQLMHKCEGIAGLGPTDGLMTQCEFISMVHVSNEGCAVRYPLCCLICLNINCEAS